VQAVARQLVERDIVSEVAGRDAGPQQLSDHLVELMLRATDLLVSMQQRFERAVVVSV